MTPGKFTDDEVPVFETGQEAARRLITIALQQGYSPLTVRTNEVCFMVPAEVARIFHGGEPDWRPPAAGEFVPPPKRRPGSRDPAYWTPERRKAWGAQMVEARRRRKEAASQVGGN